MVLGKVAMTAGLALGGCVADATPLHLVCVPPAAAETSAVALTDTLCAAVGAEMTRRSGTAVTVLPVGQAEVPDGGKITLHVLEIAPRLMRARLDWADQAGPVEGPVLSYSVEDVETLPPDAVQNFARGIVQVYGDLTK